MMCFDLFLLPQGCWRNLDCDILHINPNVWDSLSTSMDFCLKYVTLCISLINKYRKQSTSGCIFFLAFNGGTLLLLNPIKLLNV